MKKAGPLWEPAFVAARYGGKFKAVSCLVELFFFGRAGQRGDAGLSTLDNRGDVVEVLLPVEGRRTVVSQHLARVSLMHGFGEFASKLQIQHAGFAPYSV
jgi:hypothetical protein